VVEADAIEDVRATPDVYHAVFIEADRRQYETMFEEARRHLETGALVVADNVRSHDEVLGD